MNTAPSDVDLNQPASNADPAELAKFSASALRWWDPAGEFASLHAINPLRLDWINAISPLAGRQVLDVGCGGGILTESMAKCGAQALGIDLADELLKVAQLHALESQTAHLTYRAIAVETLADEMPAQFDVVTCMEMLEHVPDPASVLRACARLVKPGGWCFFSTLNRNLKALLGAIVAAEYLLRLLPRGTHDFTRFIRPNELTSFCRDAGLAPRHMRGLTYNPITRRYRLTDDTGINYMIAAQRAA